MNVSIGIEHPAADHVLPWIWYAPGEGEKEKRDYHLTVLPLDTIPNLDAVIISSQRAYDYSVKVLFEHLRLSKVKSVRYVPIYIVMSEEKYTKQIESDLDRLGTEAVYWVEEDTATLTTISELDDSSYQKVFPLLGLSPQYIGNRHTLANIWGPYRILDQVNTLGQGNPAFSELENKISRDVYFKKLLSLVERPRKHEDEVSEEFNNYFTFIKQKHLKVAVIDDDYLQGWDVAYKSLLPNSTIYGFEYSESKLFPVDSATTFDLILLDLRLHEKSNHNESDILGAKQMSGMVKLREIRKIAPLVPIIMCTASNKSWSYQEALDQGANGYWEKESPDFGLGYEYNLKNTLNLAITIRDVLLWSIRISPVFDKIEQILSMVRDPVLRSKIRKKRDVIIGQLQSPPSRYIREHYHLDSEKIAFLIIWSFVNEMVEYFKHEGDAVFSTPLEGEHEEFCTYVPDKPGRDNKKYRLSPRAVDLINSIGQDKWFGHISFEFLFMKFLFQLRDMKSEYKEYSRLREVRQALDYIHGIDPGDGGKPYAPKDLDDILDIWIGLLSFDT